MEAQVANERKACIRKIAKGKLKGQLYFRFERNGNDIGGSTPETYHNYDDAVETLQNNYPNFEIVDERDKKKGHQEFELID